MSENDEFEDVFKFLKEHNCSDTADDITERMRCTICKKVMINAYSGPCGCRYCFECVTGHLNGESKDCPGNSTHLKKKLILGKENNNNVFPDHGMNREISELIMKCPSEECEYKCKLIKMKDHQCVCEKREVKCPYCRINCTEGPMVIEKMDSHLSNSNEAHARLLMKCIGRYKEDIDAMKDDIDGLQKEKQKQQNVAKQQTGQIEALNREMNDLELDNKSMAGKIDSLQKANEKIQAKCDKQTDDISGILKLYSELKTKLADLEGKAEKETNARREDMDGLREKQTRCDNVAMRVQEVWLNVERRTRGDFMWRIDKWAERCQDDSNGLLECTVFSEVFYLHEQGHRMCLSIGPGDSVGSFSVGWHVVQGPFDDRLCWPIKCDVIVSLLNQQTRGTFSSFTVMSGHDQSDVRFQQPTEERNAGYFCNNFFSLGVLLQNPDICEDDRILIRCTVHLDLN